MIHNTTPLLVDELAPPLINEPAAPLVPEPIAPSAADPVGPQHITAAALHIAEHQLPDLPTTNPQAPLLIPLPDHTPLHLKWLVSAILAVYQDIGSLPLDIQVKANAWIALATALVRFETEAEQPLHQYGLPLDGCPPQLVHWAARGGSIPKVTAVLYLQKLEKWWQGFLPTWRPYGQWPSSSKRGWGPLLCQGTKGIFLVVFGLWAWESQHTGSTDERYRRNLALMEDVTWVISTMSADNAHISLVYDNAVEVNGMWVAPEAASEVSATSGNLSEALEIGTKRIRCCSAKALAYEPLLTPSPPQKHARVAPPLVVK